MEVGTIMKVSTKVKKVREKVQFSGFLHPEDMEHYLSYCDEMIATAKEAEKFLANTTNEAVKAKADYVLKDISKTVWEIEEALFLHPSHPSS